MQRADWDRWNCQRKDPLKQTTAEKIAKNLNLKNGSRRPVVAYRCDVCAKFHVGRKGEK